MIEFDPMAMTMNIESDDMLRKNDAFTSIVRERLAMTPIAEQLHQRSAVVLERIARGGGAVNWYYCRGQTELALIEEELSPGSVVSFYFDGRIRHSSCSPEIINSLERAIAESGEVVVGILASDGIHIDATDVVSLDDLRDFMSDIGPSAELFYGAFPSRDNDGSQAVTVTLPDNDGVLRSHPH